MLVAVVEDNEAKETLSLFVLKIPVVEGLMVPGTDVDCLSPSGAGFALVMGVLVVPILEEVDDWTAPPLVTKLPGVEGLGAPD